MGTCPNVGLMAKAAEEYGNDTASILLHFSLFVGVMDARGIYCGEEVTAEV
jgi:monomeric isocitrate dehydrogenase